MRRAGMKIGLSKSQLSKIMFEILVQLPTGTTHLKDVVVGNLGKKQSSETISGKIYPR